MTALKNDIARYYAAAHFTTSQATAFFGCVAPKKTVVESMSKDGGTRLSAPLFLVVVHRTRNWLQL